MFMAKSLPCDLLSITECMVVREDHKQAFVPKQRDIAIGGFARICHERHIKAPLSNKRNVFRRCPLNNLHIHVRILFGIGVHQLVEKTGRH